LPDSSAIPNKISRHGVDPCIVYLGLCHTCSPISAHNTSPGAQMLRLTDAIVKNAGIGEYPDAQMPGLIFIVRAPTSKAKPNAKADLDLPFHSQRQASENGLRRPPRLRKLAESA
jgi:hypothetical protein